MAIKKHDFIEIEYTAIIEDTSQIFDTTDEETAKSANIYNKNAKYNPVVICVGENQILKGLDESLVGKQLKEAEYEIQLQPEDAFGKKNPKLLQLVSQSSFRKQNIIPYPGLQINLDGIMGTIRTVTPGRIIVDFNHPLAGKKIIYKVKIKREVTDKKEKLDSLLSFYIKDFSTEINQDEVVISAKAKIEKELHEVLKEKITSLIPPIKKVTIKEE
ncbi:FKBP-type peptidyl-prolyl cis-trans isomerase [Candidatus Woesearchaeota archaeon]|nr:FKBP-type peptidyl-prolyl cis-trans isomerase [Candidatus Woesearchaeota archaeon]